MSLDDFPTRDSNSELAAKAESIFESAIVAAGNFVIQQRDRHDYGTDFQIEASQSGGMTNFRVHAQLKGTTQAANRDGSIRISVARTNLNYMLSQAHSIYVCYHAPTDVLLVRSAEDVFRDADHKGEEWRSQDTVTIRFRVPFNAEFQSTLRARIVASSTTLRDDRLRWMSTPPDEFHDEVMENIPSIIVPESPKDAFAVLQELYERGADEVISKATEQFTACFGVDSPRLIFAHLSEINLAMRRDRPDRDKVIAAIVFLEKTQQANAPDALYCRANGHGAIGQMAEAKRLYEEAIGLIGGKNLHLEAQCWKNLGSVIEEEGDPQGARRCFEKALTLAPDLMEAHYALARSYRATEDLETALHHCDQVMWISSDVERTIALRGHRLELYFRLGQSEKAYDEITVLLPHGDRHSWIFPWCARLVYNYARTNGESVLRAIRFWDVFIRKRPSDRAGHKERLLCLAHAKMHGQRVALTFQQFADQVDAYLIGESSDAAHLWDRVGHWAQIDGDWNEAEKQYRKSYSLEPDRYGYCLGTALNFLKRYNEAVPMLLEQANVHQPDAMSWFQVAVAQEGIGEIEACQSSYRRSLELDPDYDLAWFNLGGIYWNHGPKAEAIVIWHEAIERFPTHPLAAKLRREMPQFFSGD